MTDRIQKVVLKGDISDFNRAMLAAAAGAKAFSAELDSSTDRATNLTQSVLALGPALVPIAAVGVPAIAGLSNQLGFAAAGAGVAALAFKGMGDALKATNDYAIDPSTANFLKMQESMRGFGPAGRDFVAFLQELRPQLAGLKEIAREGLFPGVEAGITDMMHLLPDVERIVSVVATSVGDLIAEAGDNLDDPRWQKFFTFLEAEARPTLMDMGRTIGNLVEGFANLWMAFEPLSSQFSHSFLQLAQDFSEWTAGLDKTEGFQEFIAYIQENGPRVWEALGAIGNALLQIVEAAAPVGSAALPVIEALADAIATVADSDFGPVILGVVSLTAALSRLKALGVAANSSAMGGLLGASSYGKAAKELPSATRAYLNFDAAAGRASMTTAQFANRTERLGTSMKGAAKLAGGAAGLAFMMSDLDDKMGLTNTTMGAMIGSAFGPWGTAIGGATGLVIDLTHQTDNAAESVKQFQQAFAGQDTVEGQGKVIDAMRQQLDIAQKLADNAPGFMRDDALDQVKKFEEGLKPLEKQHRANMRAAEDQKFAEAGLDAAMRNASAATRGETLALLDNIRTKNQAADAAENAFSAETNYRRALKEAQKQAKSNSAGIEGSSDAALKNRDALDSLAGAWNKLADSGAATSRDMKKARANFIDVATGMGVSRAAAKRLADELFHLPSPKPKVELKGAQAAIEAARALRRALDAINPFKRVTIETHNTTVNDHGQQKADGGYISGPGGPRDDAIPAMLSNGEYVINAAATSRNLALLHQINSQGYADGGHVRPQRIQQFANGGLALAAAPAAPAIDSRLLATMLATATERAVTKSLYGTTFHMAPDGSYRAKSMGA